MIQHTDKEAIRVFDDRGVLVYLAGMNVMGEYGIWSDEDGLCPHESTRLHCARCKEATNQSEWSMYELGDWLVFQKNGRRYRLTGDHEGGFAVTELGDAIPSNDCH